MRLSGARWEGRQQRRTDKYVLLSFFLFALSLNACIRLFASCCLFFELVAAETMFAAALAPHRQRNRHPKRGYGPKFEKFFPWSSHFII